MAISFSDLHTEVGLKSLEQYLSGKTYISGDQLTRDDIKVYAAVSEKPGNGFPNASRWYECVSSQLAARFAGKPAGVKIAGQAAKSEPTPVEAKKDALEGDDDDLDLFGDETEEEKKASEEREAAAKASAKKKERFAGKPAGVKIAGQAAKSEPTPVEAKKDALEGDDDDLDLFGDETEEEKKASEEREAAAKASAKKKESGKSSVLMDVKPWDDETDMKKLEEAVRSIEMPGLLWGASKLVPVGYGIKKLQIMLTIVDDLVSVDNLIEDYLTAEPANEYIQSCDIVAFNKI